MAEYTINENIINKVLATGDRLTVGDLRKMLADNPDLPDDNILVTVSDEGDAVDIIQINTFWHGALTFEHE